MQLFESPVQVDFVSKAVSWTQDGVSPGRNSRTWQGLIVFRVFGEGFVFVYQQKCNLNALSLVTTCTRGPHLLVEIQCDVIMAIWRSGDLVPVNNLHFKR